MMKERGIAIPERHRTLGGNAAVALKKYRSNGLRRGLALVCLPAPRQVAMSTDPRHDVGVARSGGRVGGGARAGDR